MQSTCRTILSLGLLLWIALPGQPVLAEESSEEREMLRLSAEGVSLYKNARYREAIERFEKAFEIVQDANLLFNLGRCHQSLGQFEEAIAYYQRFIAQPGISDSDRSRAAKRIESLRAKLNARQVREPPPEDAEKNTRGASAPPPRVKAGMSTQRILAWSFIGGGGAALLLGGIFGGLALGAESDFEAATTVTDKESTRDQIKTRALVADLGIGVGLAAVTTGVVLFFLEGPRKTRQETEISIAPRLGPGEAGVVLGARF